jgi:cyclophilin family peptidyl-prolyl cis-trans isomerase
MLSSTVNRWSPCLVAFVCVATTLASLIAAMAQATNENSAISKSDSFHKALTEWDKSFSEVQSAIDQLRVSTSPEDTKKWQQSYSKNIEELIAFRPHVEELAEAAWLEQTTADERLFTWLYSTGCASVDFGGYLEANRLFTLLLNRESLLRVSQRTKVLRLAALIAFNVNQFDAAKGYAEALQKLAPSDPSVENSLARNRKYIVWWSAEQKIRSRENELNDLPRVRLVTNHGDIVLELFRNEAPNTANEFLNLVNGHALNDNPTALVKDSMILGMQIRSRNQLKTDNPEGHQRNARLHFHGSISIGKFDDSGETKIVILNRPVKEFDGVNTVFGRVVEGMPEVERILRTMNGYGNENSAERIKEATILRK